MEETNKGRGRIKAIPNIENREREREKERKKVESQRKQEVQERQSPVSSGYRLHVNREASTRRERTIVCRTVE